jgi:hypothetical protein
VVPLFESLCEISSFTRTMRVIFRAVEGGQRKRRNFYRSNGLFSDEIGKINRAERFPQEEWHFERYRFA